MFLPAWKGLTFCRESRIWDISSIDSVPTAAAFSSTLYTGTRCFWVALLHGGERKPAGCGSAFLGNWSVTQTLYLGVFCCMELRSKCVTSHLFNWSLGWHFSAALSPDRKLIYVFALSTLQGWKVKLSLQWSRYIGFPCFEDKWSLIHRCYMSMLVLFQTALG